MDRVEFLNGIRNSSGTVDREWVDKVLTKADNIGLRFYEQLGHENLIIDMEELAELSQQISKYIRGKGEYYSLLEEMADVQVCLYHLQNLYNISDFELNRAINTKVTRCENRLKAIDEEFG